MSAPQVKEKQTWRDRWIEKDRAFYRQVFLVGLPVAFQQAINIGVNLMDTVMVGALGENDPFCILAGQPILLSVLCALSGNFRRSLCTQRPVLGCLGNHKMVKQVWRLSMYISGGAALLFALATALFPAQIMGIYTNNAEMIALGNRYLQVTAWVFFFHGTSLIMVNLMRTAGVLYLGLAVSGLSFVSNIFFNYVFIFGKFGAPCLGIAGAAVGTLISRILEFAITFGYLFLGCRQIRFTPRNLVGRLDAAMLRAFMNTGMPPIISDGMFTVGDNILSVILGHMGVAVVSGPGHHPGNDAVLHRIHSGAVQRLLGHGRPGHRKGRTLLPWSGRSRILLPAVSSRRSLGGVIIAVVSPWIVGMYDLSPESRDATMQMLQAMSLLMVFQSVQSVMSKGVLRGGGDTRFLMFADLIFMWGLNIPIGYLAGLRWGWSPFWVFICLKLDTICKSFLCLWRLVQGRWIKNVNETT